MLSTGDVQGGLRKLETLLRVIKFPGPVDYTGLSKGDPSAFLPIVSYSFTSFSPLFSEQLVASGLELSGKTDLRFTETVYKILRDIFQYKPVLSKQQFLHWGFSQRKISVVCDIINLVLQRHNQLKKPKVRCPVTHKDGRSETHSPLTDPDKALPIRTYVVNHIENPATLLTPSPSLKDIIPPHLDTYYAPYMDTPSSNTPEHGLAFTTEAQEDNADDPPSVEVEERLSTLETQLENVFSAVDRLSIVEKRLEELERWRNTDKQIEEQVIIISRETWENLQSRVTLLETQLELSHTQTQKTLTKVAEEKELDKVNPPPPCVPSMSFSTSMSDASQRDLKDRLDRITNMLKSTSSLLKDNHTTTAACS